MAHKFKQVIYAGQKLVDESGGGGAVTVVDTPDSHGGTIREITAVNIDEALEEGSATPSETAQTLTPSEGKLGFSKVEVGAVSSDYVGTGVARKTSSDLSQSGATVTAPAGYYENDATKTLDEQEAQTIHPSTTDQTIASGKYLTGAQTIKAVTTTNLTAENIVSGVTVEVGDSSDPDCVASVTGTASGGTDTLEQRFKNTLTTFAMDGDVELPPNAFYNCTALISVSFPDMTTISGNYCFGACSNLESVSMPELTTITGTAHYTFERCAKLVAIFPKLTTVAAGYVFSRVNNGIIVLPAITSLGGDMFRSGGPVVDLGPVLTSLATRTFYSAAYTTIILRCSTQVVTAPADNSISGIDSGTTVYIPKALYDHLGDGTALDYRNATNWSEKTTTTFACIEGSQYENYYADGTPIPTT